MMVNAALAVRAFRGSKPDFWFCCLLLFLNGTMLEQPSVFQGVVTFAAFVYFAVKRDKHRAAMSLAFWAICVVSFLVMFLAPGTSGRMSAGYAVNMSLTSKLIRAAAVACAFGGFTALKFFIKPIVWASLLFLPSVRGSIEADPFSSVKRSGSYFTAVFLAVSFAASLMQMLGGWALNSGLPFRGESLTIWMMGFVWAVLWILCPRESGLLEKIRSSRLFALRWPVFLLCLVISANFTDLVKDFHVARNYKAEFDTRDNMTREQIGRGVENAAIPLMSIRPKLLFFCDMRPWASDWKNMGYAEYYGARSVSVLPKSVLYDADSLEAFSNGDVSPLLNSAENDPYLQLLMGEMYDPVFAHPDCIDNDVTEAQKWYTKAALAGEDQACRRLTRLSVLTGAGYLEALKWFVRSQLLILRL